MITNTVLPILFYPFFFEYGIPDLIPIIITHFAIPFLTYFINSDMTVLRDREEIQLALMKFFDEIIVIIDIVIACVGYNGEIIEIDGDKKHGYDRYYDRGYVW